MRNDLLVWVDLETTGLCEELLTYNGQDTIGMMHHRIMEIAVVLTDRNLNLIDGGIEIIIHLSDEEKSRMIPWCMEHHTASGLVDKCDSSDISKCQAERMVLDYLSKHGVSPKSSPLCGNSIRLDRNFLVTQMPKLNCHLHYRQLDVSTPKILSQMWFPDVADRVVKKCTHRALDDIIESINELKFYKSNILKDHNA
jgi:oligoribonuclease